MCQYYTSPNLHIPLYVNIHRAVCAPPHLVSAVLCDPPKITRYFWDSFTVDDSRKGKFWLKKVDPKPVTLPTVHQVYILVLLYLGNIHVPIDLSSKVTR